MAESDDLEPQQFERLYWDEGVPVKDVRKNALRKFVYVGGALCILFALAALFIKFPDQVDLPFVLKSDQSEEIYRFSYPVYIIENYTQPGVHVTKGQSLIRITSPEIVTLVNNYLDAENNYLIFSKQKILSIQKQKEMLLTRIKKNDSKVEEVLHELSSLDSSWKSNLTRLEYENDDAFKKYEITKKLVDEGHSSKFDLIESETKKIKAADALSSARHEYGKTKFNLVSVNEQNLLDNNSLSEELSKLQIDAKYDSTSLKNQLDLATIKIKNTFGDYKLVSNDLVLTAKGDGIVSYNFEGEKELSASAVLMKVIYNNSALYALVKSPPSQVGRIKNKNKVVLKVSSFPFYEWGTVKGYVDNQSLTPDENGIFSIRIAIDNFGNLKNLVQIGMNGDATIILEEKTFYQYVFNNFKKTYYKATLQ